MTAHQLRVSGLESVGVHLSGVQEGLSEDGQVEDLDPEEAMVQRGSLWVVKGTATSSGHLHPRRHPHHCVNWSSRGVAIVSCGGIAVTMDVKDGVAEALSPKRLGKTA